MFVINLKCPMPGHLFFYQWKLNITMSEIIRATVRNISFIPEIAKQQVDDIHMEEAGVVSGQEGLQRNTECNGLQKIQKNNEKLTQQMNAKCSGMANAPDENRDKNFTVLCNEAVQTGSQKIASNSLLAHQLGQEVAVIKYQKQSSAGDEGQVRGIASNDERQLSSLENLQNIQRIKEHPPEDFPLSSLDIASDLADAIKDMNEDYLKVFQDAVEKYNKFFSDFSSMVLGKMTEFMSAGKDGNVEFDNNGFSKWVDALIKKYEINGQPTCAGTLFPPQNGQDGAQANVGKSREECAAWAKEFGLSADSVVELSNPKGQFVVRIPSELVSGIKNTVPGGYINFDFPLPKVTLNAAEWSAAMSAFDQQKSNIQTAMQTLVQKYSGANSNFDNLVKILSGSIPSLQKTDENFFL